MEHPLNRTTVLLVIAATCALAGCGSPNKANIVVRKQNQALQNQVVRLQRQHEADQATIAGLTQRTGTLPTLPPERLARLFTIHAILLGRLSGGANLDLDKPGDEGFKVYVEPRDQYDDYLKCSGSFVVEAFDLAEGNGGLKLGRWEFPVEQSQTYWHSFLMRYEYVLPCPWQDKVPRHPDVTVKVTFTDELTGRQFTAQQVIKVSPPAAPSPPGPAATQPTANLR